MFSESPQSVTLRHGCPSPDDSHKRLLLSPYRGLVHEQVEESIHVAGKRRGNGSKSPQRCLQAHTSGVQYIQRSIHREALSQRITRARTRKLWICFAE